MPGHADEHVIPAHVDDNAAGVLGRHELDGLPRREDRPAQVDAQEQVELLGGRHRRGRPREHVGAGIVHPDVHAAQRGTGGARERVDGRRVAKVEPDHAGATSKGLDVARGIACPALVRAVRECDVRARPRRRDRDATSDPARRARHEHAHSSQ